MQDQNLPNTPGDNMNNTGAGTNVPPMPPPGGAGVPPQAPGQGNPPVNLTQGGSPTGSNRGDDTKDDTDGVPQQTVSAGEVGNIPSVPNTMDDLTNPTDPAGSGQSQSGNSGQDGVQGSQTVASESGEPATPPVNPSTPNLADQLTGNPPPSGQPTTANQASMPIQSDDTSAAAPVSRPEENEEQGGMQQSTVTGTQTPGEESGQPGQDNSLPPLPPSATGPGQSPGAPPAPAGSPTSDAASLNTPPDPLSEGSGGQEQVPPK